MPIGEGALTPDILPLIIVYVLVVQKETHISHSSVEAEYRGVANVVSKSCWLHNFLLEVHCPNPKATLVYCDNVSVIHLSDNPVQLQGTKHIKMDIHFVRGHARVLHVSSCYQIADIFTKSLPLISFQDFRDSLNVSHPPTSNALE